jgi:hypothetical protein
LQQLLFNTANKTKYKTDAICGFSKSKWLFRFKYWSLEQYVIFYYHSSILGHYLIRHYDFQLRNKEKLSRIEKQFNAACMFAETNHEGLARFLIFFHANTRWNYSISIKVFLCLHAHVCEESNFTFPNVFNFFNVYFVVVFFSNLSPLAYSDIIVLDYIANGQQISKLKGNEKVSLKFSNKLKNIKREQVSQDYRNLNLFMHINVVTYRMEKHGIWTTSTKNDILIQFYSIHDILTLFFLFLKLFHFSTVWT